MSLIRTHFHYLPPSFLWKYTDTHLSINILSAKLLNMSYPRLIRLIVIKPMHKILVQLLSHFYRCAYVIPDVGLLRWCWVTVSLANSIQHSPKFQAQQAGLESCGNPLMVWQMEQFIKGNKLLEAHSENFNNLYFLLQTLWESAWALILEILEYLYIWMYIC